MRTAPVGFHCPECVAQRGQRVHVPPSNEPVVTKALVAINLIVYVLTLMGGGGSAPASGFFKAGRLIAAGATIDRQLVGVDFGEWYRIFTSGFLHVDLMHVGFNMYLLYVLGVSIEPALGHLRFALLYFTSLVAGSFAVLWLDPLVPTVGASGAVFGLMAAMLVAQRAAGMKPWQSSIGILVAINLIFTFVQPNVSIGGHLGGLAGGAISSAILVYLPLRADPARRASARTLATVLVAGMLIAGFIGAIWVAGNWIDHI